MLQKCAAAHYPEPSPVIEDYVRRIVTRPALVRAQALDRG
jgi:hypothetical protein